MSPVDWKEIFMKQSVGKCKQINFYNFCLYNHIPVCDPNQTSRLHFLVLDIMGLIGYRVVK